MRNVANTEFPEWFIEELARDDDKERARNRTLSSSETVCFVCPIHGEYYSSVFNHIVLKSGTRRRGCPECAKLSRAENTKSRRLALRPPFPDWFVDELYLESDKQRARDKTLNYGREKVQFYCKEHGVYTQYVADHISYKTGERKQGCPVCGKIKSSKTKKESNRQKRPDYPQWFIDELSHDEDKQRALRKELTWSDKVEFNCSQHGDYSQRIDAHMDTKTLKPKQGCPKCGVVVCTQKRRDTQAQSRPHYPQWFIDDLANDADKQRALRNEVTTKEYLEFVCQKHGVYTQCVGNHINISTGEHTHGCLKCKQNKSSIEDAIRDYVSSIHSNVESRVRDKILGSKGRPMELDIYLPDKKIAIEVNGSLWHGENYSPKDYHFSKYLLCQKKGIRLVSIFDKDWIESGGKVKQFLKDLILEKTKVQGRKTIVQRISNKDANCFFSKYHLKGEDRTIVVSYGLFHNGELKSVMSFAKPKFGNQRDTEWDLVRYGVEPGVTIIGGAEKLFKSFLREFTPSKIVTYSDNDYFTGDIYPRLGFTFSCFTGLPYYWAKNNQFLTRQQCQVKVLKDKYPDLYQQAVAENASNKEHYIMHTLGFYKVYRSGNKKWIWNHTPDKSIIDG